MELHHSLYLKGIILTILGINYDVIPIKDYHELMRSSHQWLNSLDIHKWYP